MFLLNRAVGLVVGASLCAVFLTEPVVGADLSAFAKGSGETSPKRERGGGQVGPQTQTIPDGPGRSLVTTQCVSCHTLDMALSTRGTADEWRVRVQTMVDRGAKITSQDAAAIASYLGQHYGPGASAAAPATQSEQASALPDGPGRDVLTRKCFQCHQMSMWTALRQDRKAWESAVYRMIGRGALWTEDEIRAMADYLARIAGPPSRGPQRATP